MLNNPSLIFSSIRVYANVILFQFQVPGLFLIESTRSIITYLHFCISGVVVSLGVQILPDIFWQKRKKLSIATLNINNRGFWKSLYIERNLLNHLLVQALRSNIFGKKNYYEKRAGDTFIYLDAIDAAMEHYLRISRTIFFYMFV